MDKDSFLNVLNKHNRGEGISIEEARELLIDYCIDNGKRMKETQTFVETLITYKMLPPHFELNSCIKTAMDYYKKKFNINEVLKPTDKGYEVVCYL